MMNKQRKLSKTLGITGCIFVITVILLALLGPYAVPYDSKARVGGPLEAPSSQHLLGTNDIGQDILAELVTGARVSLTVGLIGAVIVMIIGAIIGIVAGYFGGWVDALIMRIVDVNMTLPFLPLMIVIGVFLTPSVTTQILIIGLVMWSKVTRELRSQIISLRGRGPVLAAKSMGASHTYLMRKHIFPSIFPLLIPQFVQAVNAAIMMESSLSFLGLGDPLAKSWGSMLFYANARSAFLTDAWLWWVVPPGVAIILTVLGCTFIGYWLEEKASPKLQGYQKAERRKVQLHHSVLNKLKEKSVALSSPILEVKQLYVSFPKDGELIKAVNDVSLTIKKGEIVGLVGESGSGKSTIGAAIMQLHKPPAQLDGQILFNEINLAELSTTQLRQVRGEKIALIPQAAMNALNPVMTVRTQMREAMLIHEKRKKVDVDTHINTLLEQVGLDKNWGEAFPHELSGGMKQRVVIAMALLNNPDLIIADEPTTGLDVIVQVEIIELLEKLQKQYGMAMIFISHDLPVVMRLAKRVLVMKNGLLVVHK